MKSLVAGRSAIVALTMGTVLVLGSVASASIIVFDGDSFVTEASMFAEAGGMGSEIEVPTDPLTPLENYGFGLSHAHNDGIGNSTSSVLQEYDLFQEDGMLAFSLITNAAGEFSPLHEFPFSGSVESLVDTRITFTVTQDVAVKLEGAASTCSDALPGRMSGTSLTSSIHLIQIGDDEPLCAWNSPDDPLPCDDDSEELLTVCEVELEEGQIYRLEILAQANGDFEFVIDDIYQFSTDSELLFVVLPPDEPENPGIGVTKFADADLVCPDVNTTVTYTYHVENTGDAPLTNVAVTDDKCDAIEGPFGVAMDGACDGVLQGDTLDVGETWCYDCTTTIVGQTTNTVSVEAETVEEGIEVEDEDDLTIFTNNPIDVEVMGEAICAEEGSGQVCAVATGGGGFYTVTWFDNNEDFIGECLGVAAGEQCCIDVSDEQDHTAIAVDEIGCAGEGTGNININPNRFVTVVSEQVCDGFCGDLVATAAGGTPPYDIQWFDLGGNPIGMTCEGVPENGECALEACDAVLYTAVATDSLGCTGGNTGSLDISPNPNVSIESACLDGGEAELCAVVTGGSSQHDFLWDTGATTECITVAEPGEYCVYVTDQEGCEDGACADVFEEPVCEIDGPDDVESNETHPYCGPDNVDSYQWTVSGECEIIGSDDSQCADITFTNSGSCTVSLHIVNDDDCDDECDVDVTIDGVQCEFSESLPCIESPDDTAPISVEVVDGQSPFTFDWSISEDWSITDGHDTDTVIVEAGQAESAQLCVIVTDSNGSETECCVTLNLSVDGCEGCTPGFWKNHSGEGPQSNEWVGYDPHQLFSDVFDDAFPSMTLLEVVDLGGGGLNSLGRHAVASLLNAASPNVHFPLSPQQVIDMFNDAFADGSDTEIEAVKDIFEALNEAGCPLSHVADFNEDGFVDVTDLLILLSNWGEPEPCDITATGAADVNDLIILLNNWGPTY